MNGIDPSGLMGALTIGVLSGFLTYLHMQRNDATVKVGIGTQIARALMFGAGFAGGYLTYAWGIGFEGATPLWKTHVAPRPTSEDDLRISTWVANVEEVLLEHVNSRTDLDAGQRAGALAAVSALAHEYVFKVRERAIRVSELRVSDDAYFGAGGKSGFWHNIGHPDRHCASWTRDLADPLRTVVNGSGWHIRQHWDVPKNGDISLLFFRHSFMSLTLDPEVDLSDPFAYRNVTRRPDFVLDPWPSARPDIYNADEFQKLWPVSTSLTRSN